VHREAGGCFPYASQNSTYEDGKQKDEAMRLTKDVVAALTRPAGKADYTEWDDDLPGFGVRMRGLSKKWDCQYRVNGKQRRESLGDVR
jgi:hypothetical protein